MRSAAHKVLKRILLAALLLFASGCAIADSSKAGGRENRGQGEQRAVYKGQLVTLILSRRSDMPMSYRPFPDPYETRMESEWVQTRDATEIIQAILLRELSAAGYQPIIAESRANGGDELGVRYEVTRVWITQLITGLWPTPAVYRALVSAHVSAFRGDADCMVQSYFATGEGASAWSAFSRALDRLLGQSLPELKNALAGCGTPLAATK